jgi:hypothetical protein
MNKRIEKYFRILLWKFFKFEKWHISLLSQREYAQDIISTFEQDEFSSIVEIGTGLGDIIRNINSSNKLFLDIDKSVLNANKILSYFNNRGCKTSNFNEFDIYKNSLSGKFDLIIMVNWIHNIELDVLQNKFNEFINNNLNNEGYLVFDILENKSYKYNHLVEDLLFGIKNINVEIVNKNYEYNRKLIYVRKIK